MGINKEQFSKSDQKNIEPSTRLCLAIRTNPEKIKSMTCDLKARFRNQLVFQISQAFQVRINDFSALGADDMGMRIGFMSVVSVASFGKPEFEHFIQFPQKRHGLVYGSQARGWKLPADLLVNHFHAGVVFACGKNFGHGVPRRRYPETFPLNLAELVFDSSREFLSPLDRFKVDRALLERVIIN